MTDTTEDLELFDDAKSEFPAKEDYKDRLVLIWVTGKHGTRLGENGKPYPWVETITLVIDDGPDGTSFTDLVPSVAAAGEGIRNTIQWSPTGLTARLLPKITGDKPNTFRPLRGRINSRKNAKRGLADAWSIAEPTDEDKAISLNFINQVKAITAELQNAQASADDQAFE